MNIGWSLITVHCVYSDSMVIDLCLRNRWLFQSINEKDCVEMFKHLWCNYEHIPAMYLLASQQVYPGIPRAIHAAQLPCQHLPRLEPLCLHLGSRVLRNNGIIARQNNNSIMSIICQTVKSRPGPTLFWSGHTGISWMEAPDIALTQICAIVLFVFGLF